MPGVFHDREQTTFFLERTIKRRVEALAAVYGWRKARAYRFVLKCGLDAIAANPALVERARDLREFDDAD